MKAYTVQFTTQARKDINRLQPSVINRIRAAIEKIAEDPLTGKALKAELKGLYSYRVGDYRIIYEIYHKKILVIVLKVGHRKVVYRRK